jgi:hypothetical protein
MNLVDTLSDAFNEAVADLVNALPTVIGALLILLIGWIVGRIIGGIVTSLLSRANADAMFSRYAGTIYGDARGRIGRASTLASWPSGSSTSSSSCQPRTSSAGAR